jgi:CheY-like chemotaxis protein
MSQKKILVVDDSSTVILMFKMALGSRPDFELTIARDGKEAVDKAIANPPDLILMDVSMPVMTGFEACRALRALEATRAVPIILVTTRGEVHNVQEGLAAGGTEYMTKPFAAPELFARVSRYLD